MKAKEGVWRGVCDIVVCMYVGMWRGMRLCVYIGMWRAVCVRWLCACMQVCGEACV